GSTRPNRRFAGVATPAGWAGMGPSRSPFPLWRTARSSGPGPSGLRASDRVASGRCRPEAPTDPDVLALEQTVPHIRNSLPDGSRTHGAHPRQRVAPEQEAETSPGHRALTAAAEEPLPPATLDFPEEPRERSRIARDTVVRVMSA